MLARHGGRHDRFGILLLLVLASFFVTGVNSGTWTRAVAAGLNLAVLAVAFFSTALGDHPRRVSVLAGFGIMGSLLIVSGSYQDASTSVGSLAQVFVLTAVLLAVVGRVLEHDRVGLSTILGAITAYVLIGMVFAWGYVALAGATDEPIFDPPDTGFPVYYSFVVLTTLGFGDITPTNQLVQRVSALEALIGQVFLATLVARLVSLYGSRQRESDAAVPDD